MRLSGRATITRDRNFLEAWLAIQTWPDVLDRVVTDANLVSYEHPYGFVVLRLSETKFPGWQIRVHLWPEAKTLRERLARNGTFAQQVHAHGWDLMSSVLVGSIAENTYEMVPGGGALYCVESTYGVGSSVLKKQRTQVAPRQLTSSDRGPDDGTYSIHAGVFHSSQTVGPPAASLVATSTEHQGPSLVLVERDSGDELVENYRTEIQDDLDKTLVTFDRQYAVENSDRDLWASFVVLRDPEGKVLLVNPTRRPELWQPVGGRGDARDADPVATAVREVAEEVGLIVAGNDLVPLLESQRDLGRGRIYFFELPLETRPVLSLSAQEVIESVWLSRAEALEKALYPATRQAISLL